MTRPVCPELYPDPRPSRLVRYLLPYLPRLVRLLPWLAGAPAAAALGVVLLTALPVLTWILLSVAVLAPIAAGIALFNYGWE
ncbi:MAG: hypothetical protein C4290_00810 [Chloroflexota bacterium]